MVEIGKFVQEQLQRTDLSPAERKAVESVSLQTESWTEREAELTEIAEQPVASSKLETQAIILIPQDQDRQLRDALRPFVQEYKAAKVHTPDLINRTWQGIWKVIGERVEYEYQVPACDRNEEELDQLRKDGKEALLLPDDIYTPDGLIRLGRAFPLMRSWTTTPEEAARISYGSTQGGCIDIEMSPNAPYITDKGYKEQELKDKIANDKRLGQRLPTYLIGSQFSQLLTGENFDINTWSRLPGSFYRGDILGAKFGSDGSVYVDYWSREYHDPGLGGRSEGVKKA